MTEPQNQPADAEALARQGQTQIQIKATDERLKGEYANACPPLEGHAGK